MKDKQFKGVTIKPGTKMWEFLDKGDTKSAEKLMKCINRMSDAFYEYSVVQEIRAANPDLY